MNDILHAATRIEQSMACIMPHLTVHTYVYSSSALCPLPLPFFTFRSLIFLYTVFFSPSIFIFSSFPYVSTNDTLLLQSLIHFPFSYISARLHRRPCRLTLSSRPSLNLRG